MKRKSFTQELKRQAILLIVNEGIPVQTVSTTLEVHPNSIYRWIQEYEKHGECAFLGRGSHEFIRRNEMNRLVKESGGTLSILEACRCLTVSHAGYYLFCHQEPSNLEIEKAYKRTWLIKIVPLNRQILYGLEILLTYLLPKVHFTLVPILMLIRVE